MLKFNVRVYGILITEEGKLLLSDEYDFGFTFTKFPGGGLEYGEGTRECLQREFMEECNLKVEVLDHFYTTDFFQKSAFNDTQVLSIYYIVKNLEPFNFETTDKRFDFKDDTNGQQNLRWISLKDLSADEFTLPIDKIVADLIVQKFWYQ
jgi:ADP-ribose pyrophosphatase YjhB (NUDIX family)